MYHTYAVSVLGHYELVYYCYNNKLITLENFLKIQDNAFLIAMEKQYKLFKKYELYDNIIDINLTLN